MAKNAEKKQVRLRIGNCAVSINLDRRRIDAAGKYKVAVRFTIGTQVYYHHIGESLTEKDFDKIICTDPNTGRVGRAGSWGDKHRSYDEILQTYANRVRKLGETSVLTLDKIKALLNGRSGEESFISVWDDVISNRRAGTAEAYKIALNSFLKAFGLAGYNGMNRNEEKIAQLGFAIDANIIHRWVQKLTDEGKSKTTIGIYLRACRVVVNECCKRGYMTKGKDYPFGDEKVNIPRGKSRKTEFLPVDKMTQLYEIFINKDYPKTMPESYREELHESLGLFLVMYLGNGMNLADVARLEYDDYYRRSKGNSIRFERTKTKERTNDNSEVIVPVIPQLKRIMEEIAAPYEFGERMFPQVLQEAKSDKSIMRRIQQENQNIRKRLRNLTDTLGWTELISPTWCRHSFATNLIHQGVPQAYVSAAMGHSIGGNVTMGYVGGYSQEQQLKFNRLLLNNDESGEDNNLTDFLATLSDEEKKRLLKLLTTSTKK